MNPVIGESDDEVEGGGVELVGEEGVELVGEEEDKNDEVCHECGDGGHLLCCDRCPRSYHPGCANEDIKCIPNGDWVCHVCAEGMAPGWVSSTDFSSSTDLPDRKFPSTFVTTVPNPCQFFFKKSRADTRLLSPLRTPTTRRGGPG